MKDKYNYYVTEEGTMQIYYTEHHIVAEISNCKGMTEDELNTLFEEVVSQMGEIKDETRAKA